MSPRTGRPPIANPKSERVTVRLNEYRQEVLDECAKKFGTTKADIVCRGIDLMEIEKSNSEARQLLDGIVLLHELLQTNDNKLVERQIEQIKENFRWYIESLKRK